MKKNRLNYMLIAILAITMIFAFSACGGSDEESGGSDGKTIHTEASTEVVSDYETVVYHYEDFEVPEDQAVCHFMGEVNETRHIWMRGDQAVLSPEWSIHSAAATHNYTFIWGMGGENLDYGDQDFSLITDLK